MNVFRRSRAMSFGYKLTSPAGRHNLCGFAGYCIPELIWSVMAEAHIDVGNLAGRLSFTECRSCRTISVVQYTP